MPIYEYCCLHCNRHFQSLIMKREDEQELSCPACGHRDLKRLISSFSFHVSENQRLADYNPRTRQSDRFYRDSRNIGLHAKKRAQQMGVDLGRDFDSRLEKLRTDPGSVLKENE